MRHKIVSLIDSSSGEEPASADVPAAAVAATPGVWAAAALGDLTIPTASLLLLGEAVPTAERRLTARPASTFVASR